MHECAPDACNAPRGYPRDAARPQPESAAPDPQGARDGACATSTTTIQGIPAVPHGIPHNVPDDVRPSDGFRTKHLTATRHPSSPATTVSPCCNPSDTSFSVAQLAGIRPARCVRPAGSLI